MCKHQNIRDNQKNENLARNCDPLKGFCLRFFNNNANLKFSFLVICTINGSLLEYTSFIIKTDIFPLKNH